MQQVIFSSRCSRIRTTRSASRIIKEAAIAEKENFGQCRTLPDLEDSDSPTRDQKKVQTETHQPQWVIDLNNTIFKDKQQVQHRLALVAHREGLLEKQRQALMELKQFMDKEAAEIKAQKVELKEIEPWLEMIKGVAQSKNMDVKEVATFIAQTVKLSQEFGGIQRQIERANQELTLINMAIIKKQQAVTVVEDLLNRGVTESQIIQLTSANQKNGSLGSGSSSPNNNGGPSM